SFDMRSKTLTLSLVGALFLALPWWLHLPRRSEASVTSGFDPRNLQPGDVILRRGRDAVSAMVLTVDQGSRFSHVGLVVRLGDLRAVVHALPGDEAHPDGQVLVQSVGEFLAPERASEVAVYRLTEPSGVPAAAAAVALRYVREGRHFDADFRLETARELYCSELVWRAFRESGLDLLDARLAHLALPLRQGEFVLPSSFTKSPHLKLLTQEDIGS
ncbi:MAG TPA: YiiX/YebB-like N1pC/P60 family cysteine hydrolase, partial [Rubrobacter sp.]|nr:YiiX/YebB-like N1pC/P60 family cysteine hydrolase [Rubrobacter sp.]